MAEISVHTAPESASDLPSLPVPCSTHGLRLPRFFRTPSALPRGDASGADFMAGYHHPQVLPKATADAGTKSQECKPFRFDLV